MDKQMNEQEQAQAFNEALDHLMAGRPAPEHESDSQELRDGLALAERLTALDLAAGTTSLKRDIRAGLTARNKKKDSLMELAQNKRRMALAGITASILLVAVFVLTPVGAYAQNFLRQLGGITLTDNPTLVEQLSEGEVISDPEDMQGIPTAAPPENLSGGEVEERAGYSGWLPTFVPEGYVLTSNYVDVDYAGNPFIAASYVKVVGNEATFFHIDQSETVEERPAPYGRWAIGDAPVSDVLVNGNEAVFVEQANIIALPDPETPGAVVPGGANILIWTADGYTFSLMSMHLDQATMIQIAESMQPQQ